MSFWHACNEAMHAPSLAQLTHDPHMSFPGMSWHVTPELPLEELLLLLDAFVLLDAVLLLLVEVELVLEALLLLLVEVELVLEAPLDVELALEALLLLLAVAPVLVAPVEAWLVEPPIPVPVVVEKLMPPVPLALLWLPLPDAADAPPAPLELDPVPRPPVANGQAMTRNESGSKARARTRRILRSSAKARPFVTRRYGTARRSASSGARGMGT